MAERQPFEVISSTRAKGNKPTEMKRGGTDDSPNEEVKETEVREELYIQYPMAEMSGSIPAVMFLHDSPLLATQSTPRGCENGYCSIR